MTVAETGIDPVMPVGPPARRLRVCMVHYSHFEVDSRVQRQAYSLAERGDSVDAVCLSEAGPVAHSGSPIRLHQIGTDKPRHSVAGYLGGYARFFAGAFAKVSALHREQPFDLVEVHNMPDFLTFAAALPKLSGTPILLDVHDTFAELFATKFGVGTKSIAARMIETEERVSSWMADGMLAVTQEARERLESRGVGRGKIRVVMNSPDERVFGPAREALELPAEGPVNLVYHGGMAPRFGVETLVRAASLLADTEPRVRARVYGSCEEENEGIARLAAHVAPDTVQVAPKPTPFTQIPGKLAECHIGIVPTLRDEFTSLLLPVKLMEYVHMGLPVVSSRLPVTQHYFGEDEVRFFEPGSPESMAEAIRDVLADPAAAQERARRASRRLETFSWPHQRSTYLSVVDTLTRSSSRAASAV